jgi:hypothetical protein
MKRENLSNIFPALLLCMMAAFFAACSSDSGAKKLFPVVKDGKWGYMNNQGKIVIEPQFDAARDFHDGLALVSKFDKSGDSNAQAKNGKDGYIDETGKFVIEPQFITEGSGFAFSSTQTKRNFSDGLAVVTIGPSTQNKSYNNVIWDEKLAAIDKTGKIVFEIDPKYEVKDGFSDGMLLVGLKNVDGKADKFGFLDKTGKVAIEPKYITAFPFSEGLAAVSMHDERYGKKDVYHGYIDTSGKTAIEFQFKQALPFSEGLAAVISEDGGDNFEFIDKTGKMAINRRFPQVGDFHDGLVVSQDPLAYTLIDKTGSSVGEREYGTARNNFSEGLAIVTDDKKKMQIIDKSGDIVAPVDEAVRSGRIGDFQGGLCRIIDDDEKGDAILSYINKKGKIVWKDKMDKMDR